MTHRLDFAQLVHYDAGRPGITVPVTLSLIGRETTFGVKVDTGSSECVFARQHGIQLGLDIEGGEQI